MTFEDLAFFWALAERQSITEAARAVSISQPTASRRLKAMEQELGAPLVERDGLPLTLTPFGFLFLDFADEVLKKYRALRLAAEETHSVLGTLTVATSSSPAARLVTRWLADFLAAQPGVRLRLTELNSRGVEERIRRGEADLGFMGTPPQDPSLTSLVIGEDEVVLLVPRHSTFHHLPRPATWEQIRHLPFIARTGGSGTQKVVESLAGKNGWPPLDHIVLEVDSASGVVDAVESGLGAGFVSREVLFRRDLTRSSVWPVKGLSIVRPFYLVYHAERAGQEPLTTAFLRYAHMRLNTPHMRMEDPTL